MNRRAFLKTSLTAAAGLLAPRAGLLAQTTAARDLKARFADLSRHFIFEYYPWYSADPVRHWNQGGHRPPLDLAANYVPLLGAYDSASAAVLEQHAQWIAETGAGAVNVSWWGPGSDIDRLVPTLLDVMAAHDIRVTFHLEPYREHHAVGYASDIEYLIRKYGDDRRWDCLLLLTGEDGRTGPVFKTFRTILPETSTDCHGRTSPVPDFASDDTWRAQTDRVRANLRRHFDRVTLLADALDVGRVSDGGFDGIAIYDNFVRPAVWRQAAENCTARNLVFSFNVNPGFDGVVDVTRPPDACDVALPFEPGGGIYDWSSATERDRAAAESVRRIEDSFRTTMDLQTDERLANVKRGFFLVYLNSFNEWHEGHQFEPMKNAAALSDAERARTYHNPTDGRYRFDKLKELLASVLP